MASTSPFNSNGDGQPRISRKGEKKKKVWTEAQNADIFDRRNKGETWEYIQEVSSLHYQLQIDAIKILFRVGSQLPLYSFHILYLASINHHEFKKHANNHEET
jgi:hypothetical protein